MNPRIKALQDELQAIIDRGQALNAQTTPLSDDDQKFMDALETTLAAKQAELDRAKASAAAIDKADSYLNDMAPVAMVQGVPQAVAGLPGVPALPTQLGGGVQVLDPTKLSLTSRARPHFLTRDLKMDKAEARVKAYRFGMWVLAALKNHAPAKRFCAANGIPIQFMEPGALDGQSEGINEDGGFLIPPEFDDLIIDLKELYGVFRRNARISSMTKEQKMRNRRKGGLTAHWISEGETIDVSKKNWDQVKLNAKTLAALARWSVEWGEDAIIDAADDLAGEMAWAFAKEEDEAGFVGDGTSTNGRIVGCTTRLLDVYTTAGGKGLILGAGNLWSELVLNDFAKVVGALPQYAAAKNPQWFCSRPFYAVLVDLMLEAGGVTDQMIATGTVWKNPMFMGYQVQITQAMPMAEANGQVPIVFGDLSLAAEFGDRRQTTIALSEHLFFDSNELAVRGTERLDINVHSVGDANAAGPLVGLVTASS